MLYQPEIPTTDPAQLLIPTLVDEPEKLAKQTGMPFPDYAEPNENGVNTAIHPGVYKILGGIFFGILLAFFWVFRSNAETVFAIGICAVYCIMYFGTPMALARFTPQRQKTRQSFWAFLDRPLDTWTGKITGREALFQICLIPAALLVCTVAICVIIANVRL